MGTLVNRRQLAEIFGVTEKTIGNWQKSEGFPLSLVGKRGTSNEYDTAAVIEWYVAREISKLVINDGDGTFIDYDREKARLTKAQADHEELKVSILRGDVIPAPVVVDLCQSSVAAARAKLLGIHNKVKSRCPEASEATIGEIENQVREALEELGADGLPSGIRKSLGRYLANVETAAETVGE